MLTRAIITSFFLCAGFLVSAQVVFSSQRMIDDKLPNHSNRQITNARSTGCGPDTVSYARVKASGSLRILSINNASSADKAGQWFEAPQQMMLHGFTFYAWLTAQVQTKVPLICRVYLSGTDSLPTGPLLASDTILVDTTGNGSTNISVFERNAVFDSPILVNQPFVLVVENNSPLNINMVTNDWDSLDGRKEWRGMASIPGSGWLHGYTINVGGVPFDADFAMEPYVSYDIDADFEVDTFCLAPGGGPVQFTNLSNNPILASGVYNQNVYLDSDSFNYQWNYGDSTSELIFENTHNYGAGYDFDVTLSAVIQGWSALCFDEKEVTINPTRTVADFDFNNTGSAAAFTSLTEGSDYWNWNFGDSVTSSVENPSHFYSEEGIYDVSLSVGNVCGKDSITKTVVLCDSLENDWSFAVQGYEVNFINQGSGADIYQWDFDDGTGNISASPLHTFPDTGTYNVCLFTENGCFSDTYCQDITISLTTGIFDWNVPLFNVYPNPANNEVIVELDKTSHSTNVRLYNAQGQLYQNILNDRAVLAIDVQNYPAGVYWIKLISGEKVDAQKLLIAR